MEWRKASINHRATVATLAGNMTGRTELERRKVADNCEKVFKSLEMHLAQRAASLTVDPVDDYFREIMKTRCRRGGFWEKHLHALLNLLSRDKNMSVKPTLDH